MASPSASSTHRPRIKKRLVTGSTTSNNDLILENGSSKGHPAFPLVSFLWAARGGVSQWLVLPLILMVAGLFRWAVGLWGYSGFKIPPMHGDYEAQRHWMELTIHLPITQWYFYDLQYWGLDYPPLTAYHSWLLGKLGSILDPAWFALETSRGIEEPLLKVYMRATVLISEYLIYVPAVIVFARRYSRLHGEPAWSASIALVAILLQPATLLIDHGHFQYNTVMLGFVVASLEGILTGRYLQSCVFFVAALGFKQMALYYSPIMFSFLLGVCIFPRIRIDRLFSIALTTVFAFAVLFAPFIAGSLYHWTAGHKDALPKTSLTWVKELPPPLDTHSWYYPPIVQLSQAIHRIFPFARGLFEDKVANAWCTIHTFYKLHRFPTSLLQRASLGATVASIVVPCLVIFLKPRANLLLYALASSAWGFFLFSFQVHEKSVLLPLLPMTLLLSGENGLSKETRAWVGWANLLGSWTLFPLLKREDLRIPYFVITSLWAYLMGLPPTSIETYRARENQTGPTVHPLTAIIHFGFFLGMIVWHIVEAFIPQPEDKPDLWVVLNVLIGAAGFSLAYLWCTWKLVSHAFWTGGRSVVEDTKKNQ